LRKAIEKISGDLCISRPKSRLDWGIELPFDRDFVTYVWFDALSNYISFAGYDSKIVKYESQPAEFRDKWPALQVIGKDILIPAHGIYWLAMLHALGFPDDQMPQLLVHGWWNLSGAKISKSAGNAVDPFALIDKYGAETLRYYLTSDIATGSDADFNEERLVTRYHTDLANSIGNLLNRTLNMMSKYQESCVQFPKDPWLQNPDEHQLEKYSDRIAKEVEQYQSHMSMNRRLPVTLPFTLGPYVVNAAINNILEIANQGNALVENAAPWKLAKDSSEVSKTKLNAVLYSLAESLRIIAILISPVLPRAAHGIFDQLNWKMDLVGKEKRFHLKDTKWGDLPDGHVVGNPTPLFESWHAIAERLSVERVRAELGGTVEARTPENDFGFDARILTPGGAYLVEVKASSSSDAGQIAQVYSKVAQSIHSKQLPRDEKIIFVTAYLSGGLDAKASIGNALEQHRLKQKLPIEYRVYHVSEL